MKTYLIRVPEPLHTALKEFCAREGYFLSGWVAKILTAALKAAKAG